MARRLNFPVRYGSPELACLHEAGHAVAGIRVGARIVEMQLYLDPLEGRTRADRNDMQARTIALGGFAIERRLWEEGRLLLSDGSIPTERQMLNESALNANVDRITFHGGDYRGQDGYWPRDMDLQFMQAAQQLGQMIDMSLVERLAEALLTERLIDESRVKEIVDN